MSGFRFRHAQVVISKEVVEGTARPLYIYADRADRTGDASAS
jgi:ATP-dependent Clp protease ATP-binding subunit ClpX